MKRITNNNNIENTNKQKSEKDSDRTDICVEKEKTIKRDSELDKNEYTTRKNKMLRDISKNLRKKVGEGGGGTKKSSENLKMTRQFENHYETEKNDHSMKTNMRPVRRMAVKGYDNVSQSLAEGVVGEYY